MSGLTQRLQDLYERSEEFLGRSWPVWVAAILFYAACSWVLLTKVRFSDPLFFVVFVMAVVIVTLTLIRIEWALLGLCAMIAFTRPGISFGVHNAFHVSGFNVALLGVWVVYLIRYASDRTFAAKGPLVRKTPIDRIAVALLLLMTLAMMVGLTKNTGGYALGRVVLYWKEHVLYFAWFYLVVTFLREPRDLRRFATTFAVAGVLVAAIGLLQRFGGAVEAAHATEEQLEAGVMGGGRSEGTGFLGLGHPNFLGAFLIMSLPTWFFMVDHLKRWYHRVLADIGILMGLLALLFTYSRSAWMGVVGGIGMLGLTDRRALRRIFVFLILFAIVAQSLSLAYAGRGVVDLISFRFQELSRSGYSSRPAIFRAAFDVIAENPVVGVGPSAFPWHADHSMVGGRYLSQAHNLLLTLAAEDGIPFTLVFMLFMGVILRMAFRNLRALARYPGYAFIAQGAYAGLLAVLTQSFVVHLFYHRNVGFAFYALLAIIVSLDRMIREGRFEPPAVGEIVAPDGTWKGQS